MDNLPAQAHCPVCGDTFGLERVLCAKCQAPHHEPCFGYRQEGNAGCASYACGSMSYLKFSVKDGAVVGFDTIMLGCLERSLVPVADQEDEGLPANLIYDISRIPDFCERVDYFKNLSKLVMSAYTHGTSKRYDTHDDKQTRNYLLSKFVYESPEYNFVQRVFMVKQDMDHGYSLGVAAGGLGIFGALIMISTTNVIAPVGGLIFAAMGVCAGLRGRSIHRDAKKCLESLPEEYARTNRLSEED